MKVELGWYTWRDVVDAAKAHCVMMTVAVKVRRPYKTRQDGAPWVQIMRHVSTDVSTEKYSLL